MTIKKLDHIFKPKRIALIGVSNNFNDIGGITLKNLVGGGFNGVVYPINPKREAIFGIPCYPDVESCPKTPDLAVIMTNAELVPQLIKECGEAGIYGIIIMSSGFRESGKQKGILEAKIQKEKLKFPSMRIIGPNSLGILIPRLNMNISFAKKMPKKGHVAFISQSRALSSSVLDWAYKSNIGFSNFVSIGNSTDVNFGDLIDYFGQDQDTKSIVLYLESITNARTFMSAARAFSRKKPITVYKSGRFPESEAIVAAHFNEQISEDCIYHAAFRRAGLARIFDFGNIFDFTDLVSRRRIPAGNHLAIISNAFASGLMAVDSLASSGGKLIKLSDETIDKLKTMLTNSWGYNNPVKLPSNATPKQFADVTEVVLQDKQVDAVLVILTPQSISNPTATAKAIVEMANNTTKSVMAAWFGSSEMKEAVQIFGNAGIASYSTPEKAIRAFTILSDYATNQRMLYETPREVPLDFNYDRNELRKKYRNTIFIKSKTLNNQDAKALINDYGIKTTQPTLAMSENEAAKVAKEKGYPVAMKVHSSNSINKTEIGEIILNIKNEEMVRANFCNITKLAKQKFPQLEIQGVTIQKMINTKDGIELNLSTKKDPIFGTIMQLETGGTTAEFFKDKHFEFPPLNEKLAQQMIKSLQVYPLLKSWKETSPKNIDKLIEALIRISYLAADYPEIEELNINPLIVTPDEVVALDAKVTVDTNLVENPAKDYSHLVLRPYPESLIKACKLKDGTDITLRPIRPEDEPMWVELLNGCSKESIYSRFRYDFYYDSHEIATQFCFIDYDREIAIVAEHEKPDGTKELIGIGRLIADPDMEIMEYAILVSDAWQKKELGLTITRYCLKIAENSEVKKLAAETTRNNKAMLSVFRKLNFKMRFNEDSTVSVTKLLHSNE